MRPAGSRAYPARMRACLALLLLSVMFGVLPAQQLSPWQGEWGFFTGEDAQVGQRLSIHDCQGTVCRFSLESRSGGGDAGTSTDESLTIQSDTSATATLPGATVGAVCILHFDRQTSPTPAIIVQGIGDTCVSYYSTSAAITMDGTYPLRSTGNYTGPHSDECFLDNSPSRTAICAHPNLANLEQNWQDLAEEYPLQPQTSNDQSAYVHAEQLDESILRSCDSDATPATCLTTRYTNDIAAMQAKKDAFLDGTTQRGDPAEGGKLTAKIAGYYRHSFPNGDVQGDSFTSTDTLTIRPVGAASIHFDIELNFYNGDSCSLSGGALYRKDGSFVFDDSPANNPSPDTPVCRLAIIPTGTGIKFNDINGSCKSYCGVRGGWYGEGFLFSERIANQTDVHKN